MIFSQNQTNFLPSPCPNNLAPLCLLFQNCAQTKYTKPGGNSSSKTGVEVALVFLENAGFAGEELEKAGWGVERGFMEGMWAEQLCDGCVYPAD